ncbi:hypothetical protein [Ureibacillus acetophenoni]|uniref:Na+/glutamate symporter n=1 Tax=Ureibacillus acetophenoni TaxID=614649 RepID=A0A285UR48_9BACL|nr:hypothetical protein [Ureibacillus acetophenoni]SOC44385.1 Na+/glutamate symporter [Ureibacillus acetophenoni]
MAQMVAIVILLFILYIGDFVSIRTKAWIPSIFVSAVLFLIGYWTFFPQDIVAVAGIPNTVATLLIYLLIVNMGTLLSVKELIAQWKTVVISLSGILGIIVVLLGIASLIFDMNTVIVAIPPLVGGIVSALIMSEGATQAGLTSLAVFAVVIYVMQGFAGYPLTSIVLKKEGKKLLQQYRNGELVINTDDQKVEETEEKKQGLKIFQVPEKYNTEYFKFFKIALVGCLAYLTSTFLAPVVEINGAVLALVFGVIAKSIGFLETHALQKANGFGFAIMGLMLFVFDALKSATPSMLFDLLTPLVVCIALGVIGMYIFSFIAGKLLKVSKNLAFAVSLTALYGFPADFVITNEVIKSLTTDEKERKALTSVMLPPMLVGGFVSVTMVSVILAGIFVTFLK